MNWQCKNCGFGPFEITVFPVFCKCGSVTQEDGSVSSSKNYTECIHRGSVIGTHICEVCSEKGKVIEVYHCNFLNSPCTIRRWENTGKARKLNEISCLTCEHKTYS